MCLFVSVGIIVLGPFEFILIVLELLLNRVSAEDCGVLFVCLAFYGSSFFLLLYVVVAFRIVAVIIIFTSVENCALVWA